MDNVRHDRYGSQAHFKHQGHQYTKRFKAREIPDPSAREAAAREWIANAQACLQLGLPVDDASAPRFPQDVKRYLQAVQSMPSFRDREFHMQEWARVFAGRDRNSITPLEIRTQLEGWRRTLAPSSCNKRRTALMSFYTRLNGKSGYNPVRDVEKYAEDEEPRSQHPYAVLRVLVFMRRPYVSYRMRAGKKKRLTPTLIRLLVLLTTGWPHAQIARLKPQHLDLKNGRAFVTPRRKGKGHRGKWLPLLPAAVRALTLFQREDCFTKTRKDGAPQPFSASGMHSAFARALAKLNAHRRALQLPPLDMHPYDLRHTFGTAVARRVDDDRVLQELMLHSRREQSRRYTEEATAGRIERALAPLLEPRVKTPQTRQD